MDSSNFELVSNYSPKGDQPTAIEQLVKGLEAGEKEQTLLGATGTGKTFTMANIVHQVQRPTLVLVHNKTLAAQLYNEFKSFFPGNAVHYFVSYFDYYQPEAYVAQSDTYIEKDSDINEEIDRLRHAATDALLSRKDVLIVASVSCIYGIGSVEDYGDMSVAVGVGERKVRDKFIRHLTDIQYRRNDIDFARSTFRVKGDTVDVFPASEELAYRIEFFGDEVERIAQIDPLTGELIATPESIRIFPGSHYVTPENKLKAAIPKIEQELEQRITHFESQNMILESQRLGQRTRFDLEMLQETGFVKGIENYSRFLTNREEGEQPATLLDYFPDDYLLMIDESHMTIPQVRGMYNGDRARKQVLVDHGFRLPSALDNRPLNFIEFEGHVNQVIYVSATPADYEHAGGCHWAYPDHWRHGRRVIGISGLHDVSRPCVQSGTLCHVGYGRHDGCRITGATRRPDGSDGTDTQSEHHFAGHAGHYYGQYDRQPGLRFTFHLPHADGNVRTGIPPEPTLPGTEPGQRCQHHVEVVCQGQSHAQPR